MRRRGLLRFVKRWTEQAALLGRNIEYIRRARGMTRSALVSQLGDGNVANFRKLVRGERNVTLATLVAIADALGVHPCRLFEEPTTQEDRLRRHSR